MDIEKIRKAASKVKELDEVTTFYNKLKHIQEIGIESIELCSTHCNNVQYTSESPSKIKNRIYDIVVKETEKIILELEKEIEEM